MGLTLADLIAFNTVLMAAIAAPARRGYISLKPMLDRIAATLPGALGLRLILEK